MSTTPLSGSILAHFFTSDEKIKLFKSVGIIIGFFGVVFLFMDRLIINEENYLFALITILGSTFYSIGGILTLKLKNKGNINVTTSTTYGRYYFYFLCQLFSKNPELTQIDSTLSLIYLGVVANNSMVNRFRILIVNGLVFQTCLFNTYFCYSLVFYYGRTYNMEVLVSLVIIIFGIYLVKKIIKNI